MSTKRSLVIAQIDLPEGDDRLAFEVYFPFDHAPFNTAETQIRAAFMALSGVAAVDATAEMKASGIWIVYLCPGSSVVIVEAICRVAERIAAKG